MSPNQEVRLLVSYMQETLYAVLIFVVHAKHNYRQPSYKHMFVPTGDIYLEGNVTNGTSISFNVFCLQNALHDFHILLCIT